MVCESNETYVQQIFNKHELFGMRCNKTTNPKLYDLYEPLVYWSIDMKKSYDKHIISYFDITIPETYSKYWSYIRNNIRF